MQIKIRKFLNGFVAVLLLCMSVIVAGKAFAGSSDQVIKIKDAQKQLIVKINFSEGYVKAKYSQQELRAQAKENGKTYYRLNDKDYASVKHRDGGFNVAVNGVDLYKVRHESKKLKVQLIKDQITLLEVKDKDDKYKVFVNDTHIGDIKLSENGTEIKIKSPSGIEMYNISSNTLSPAYGLMLLGGISDEDKFLMMMELLAAEM